MCCVDRATLPAIDERWAQAASTKHHICSTSAQLLRFASTNALVATFAGCTNKNREHLPPSYAWTSTPSPAERTESSRAQPYNSSPTSYKYSRGSREKKPLMPQFWHSEISRSPWHEEAECSAYNRNTTLHCTASHLCERDTWKTLRHLPPLPSHRRNDLLTHEYTWAQVPSQDAKPPRQKTSKSDSLPYSILRVTPSHKEEHKEETHLDRRIYAPLFAPPTWYSLFLCPRLSFLPASWAHHTMLPCSRSENACHTFSTHILERAISWVVGKLEGSCDWELRSVGCVFSLGYSVASIINHARRRPSRRRTARARWALWGTAK